MVADRVYIKNNEELEEKIKFFIDGGPNNFHVISDFDHTLTPLYHKGEKTTPVPGLLRDKGYFNPEYKKRSDIVAKVNLTTDFESNKHRAEVMISWWEQEFSLLKKYGCREKAIELLVVGKHIISRPGCDEFYSLLKKNDIPLLVFSAGIANIIDHYYKDRNDIPKKTHILSNHIYFDENGNMEDYTKGEDIIHPYNKGEISIHDTTHFDHISRRENVIVMGDIIADTKMGQYLDATQNSIKIGFYNSLGSRDSIGKYMVAFDVVLAYDASMNYVNELIEKIVAKPVEIEERKFSELQGFLHFSRR
jgi:cytosolic 5'-nucleotidase 3